MIFDFYFRKPVLIDYVFSIIIVAVNFFLFVNNKIAISSKNNSYSLTGDLTNVSLTMAGFILTILTVLITFKENSPSESKKESNTIFNKFFSTDYYFESIKHLKNCIKSIVFIAALGFFLQIFINEDDHEYFFFYNILGLIVLILSVQRCLLILSKILTLQKESHIADL